MASPIHSAARETTPVPGCHPRPTPARGTIRPGWSSAHGREQPSGLGHVAAGEFVVGAFTGQQRPRSADAGAVEGPAVLVLAVTVAAVTIPAGAGRQFDAQRGIDRPHRADDPRIICRTQPETNQRERVRADDIGGRVECVFNVSVLDLQLGRQPGWRRDAHVVAVDPRAFRQVGAGRERPAFDRIVPGVGGVANETALFR